jgi:uncharacterized membrane protein
MVAALGLVTVAGVLFVVLGWMGLLGKLPPNHIAGIRTPFTMRSEQNWYATHRAAAPLLIFGGVAATMAGLAFFPFAAAGKVSDALAASVCVAVAVLLGVTAITGWLFGTRRARSSGP